MPKNKNASFRYRVLDSCFRNTGRNYSMNDLIEEVSEQMNEHFGIDKGISKRTIQDDISIMRSEPPRGFGAPIVCENGFYSYEDSSFTINNNPLNTTDINNLKEVNQILKQFKQLPVYGELHNLINRVEEDVMMSESYGFLDLEKNTNYYRIELLSDIYKAFQFKKQLEITYQPFRKKEKSYVVIHPLLIKEYRNRWFVVGWSDYYSGFSVLAVDRIISFRVLNADAHIEKKNQLEKIYNMIIGVTIPTYSKVEKIKLFVNNTSRDYVLTKPIHSSQETINETEDGVYLTLDLIVNFEFKQLILSYLPNIAVIEPLELRKEIKDDLDNAKMLYK